MAINRRELDAGRDTRCKRRPIGIDDGVGQAAGAADIIKAVPENYLLGDRAVYIDAFMAAKGALSPDGMFPEAGAATAVRALQSIDETLKDVKFDLAAAWTNDFVRKERYFFSGPGFSARYFSISSGETWPSLLVSMRLQSRPAVAAGAAAVCLVVAACCGAWAGFFAGSVANAAPDRAIRPNGAQWRIFIVMSPW